MASDLTPTDTAKFNIVHRLRLHEAALRKEASMTDAGALDLADTLMQAKSEIFRLRHAASESALLLQSLGGAVIALVKEAEAAIDAVPMEARDGR